MGHLNRDSRMQIIHAGYSVVPKFTWLQPAAMSPPCLKYLENGWFRSKSRRFGRPRKVNLLREYILKAESGSLRRSCTAIAK